jgi:hypothetical protein
MALIEVFHVVASDHPIDADDTTNIPQGCLVTPNPANGQITLCDGDTMYPLGIAGDTRSTGITSYTPESGSAQSRDPASSPFEGALVLGALGASVRFTQNRIADNYNEVLASGQMTVYHSGGEFWTDQYEIAWANGTTVNAFNPGSILYASGAGEAVGTGELVARAGRFTEEPGTAPFNMIAGLTLNGPLAYPSGVPGTDVGFASGLGGQEGANSIQWGQFLHIKLHH